MAIYYEPKTNKGVKGTLLRRCSFVIDMGKIKCTYTQTVKALEKMKTAPGKVVHATINDFKKRGPGWIATEVTQHYGIKKNDIKPTVKNSKSAGTIRAAGRTVSTVRIIYKGRVLTPVRFGMTPKTPRASYTLKAEITKGGKKTLGKVKKLTKKQRQNVGRNFTRQGKKSSNKSPVMLMSTGNAQAGGTNFIPFQRVSRKRNDIKAIKTLSVPQMVSNPQVEKDIYNKLSKEIGKRFEHYTERYLK